jgi:hypothetical protein
MRRVAGGIEAEHRIDQKTATSTVREVMSMMVNLQAPKVLMVLLEKEEEVVKD